MTWTQLKFPESGPKLLSGWALQASTCVSLHFLFFLSARDGIYFLGGRNHNYAIHRQLFLIRKDESLNALQGSLPPAVCAGG
jgi:hypothetical protein